MKPLALLLLLLPALALAQTPAPTTPLPLANAQALWRCQLPGGVYEVAVRSILSVSSHEYLVDGAARVTEVNIDTAGTLLARFYFLEPATPSSLAGLGTATLEKAQQLLVEGSDKTGLDAWRKVVKSYPATTHARTAEYRLQSKDQLQRLFESAETAFRLGKGSVFTAQ